MDKVVELLTYKFRLYPTAQQEVRLEEALDGRRWLYNHFLRLQPMSEYDMNYALTELKEHHTWLRNYHSKMLQMVGKKVWASRKALLELKKRGYRIGKMRYLRNEECGSFTYNQSGYWIEQLFEGRDASLLHLSKIGGIVIRTHRQFYDIAQVTVVRQAGRLYAMLVCKISRLIKQSRKKPVGIDVGIRNYAYDSDGNHVDNPLFMKKDLKKIRRSSKRLSRRIFRSKNFDKALQRHHNLHMAIANKRRDFLHKLSNNYATKYDVIFLERLRLNNIKKNHFLARHIMDSSWCTFKDFLRYKVKVVDVDPYNITVDCNRCGNKVQKTLAARLHEWDRCGTVLDRDHNAALNILQKGLELLELPMRHGEVTPAKILS